MGYPQWAPGQVTSLLGPQFPPGQGEGYSWSVRFETVVKDLEEIPMHCAISGRRGLPRAPESEAETWGRQGQMGLPRE